MSSAPPFPHLGKPLRHAYLGLIAFVPINLVILFVVEIVVHFAFGFQAYPSPDLGRGAVFAATVAVLAALSYFVLRLRAFAAGLVGGYLLMTIFSAGTCTVFNLNSSERLGRAASGLLLYLLAIAILGIALLIVRFTSKRW